MTQEVPSHPVVVETIICPNCGASLEATADRCPHCETRTTDKGPLGAKARLIDRPWLIVVVLLHLGVLGIPLFWCSSYSLGVRLWIVLASILYTIVAVAGIVWGLLQIARVFGFG